MSDLAALMPVLGKVTTSPSLAIIELENLTIVPVQATCDH
jgi:hypothetical protein